MATLPLRPAERRPSWLGAIGVLTRVQCGERLHLVIRRAEGIRAAGAWCFPGGAVEPGETSREAVVRELREELGVVVMPRRALGLVTAGTSSWRLAAWLSETAAETFRPDRKEVAELAWLTAREIETLPDGMPSNARVLELLERVQP